MLSLYCLVLTACFFILFLFLLFFYNFDIITNNGKTEIVYLHFNSFLAENHGILYACTYIVSGLRSLYAVDRFQIKFKKFFYVTKSTWLKFFTFNNMSKLPQTYFTNLHTMVGLLLHVLLSQKMVSKFFWLIITCYRLRLNLEESSQYISFALYIIIIYILYLYYLLLSTRMAC